LTTTETSQRKDSNFHFKADDSLRDTISPRQRLKAAAAKLPETTPRRITFEGPFCRVVASTWPNGGQFMFKLEHSQQQNAKNLKNRNRLS